MVAPKYALVYRVCMGRELLAKYLEDNENETGASFAARAGVSAQALSSWLGGGRVPDVYSAKLIEDATGGAVPIASWAKADRRRHSPAKPTKRAKRVPQPKAS